MRDYNSKDSKHSIQLSNNYKHKFKQYSNKLFRLVSIQLIICAFFAPNQQILVNAQQSINDIKIQQNKTQNYDDSKYINVQRQLQEEDVDEENQILQGAADTDFNNASQNKDNNPAIQEQVNTIKSQIQSSANVAKTQQNSWETNDVKERFINGDIKLTLDSIVPRGGPLYGTTRVTVRAAGLEDLVEAFPDPKCRFGHNNQIVEADYVKCTKGPIGFYDREKGVDSAKNSTCIQCEASPKNDKSEIIALTVSLTGKFDDVSSSQPFRYYDPVVIKSIYPRYGPKDGDTVVQIWGDNFLDMGDDFRCNFGTRSTKAHFIDEHYVWCRAAPSDVVGRPMPFSISMNRQQNSMQKYDYWYYNEPQINLITPDYGPMGGGTKITIKGSQFFPFDWKLDINNQNDTFCNWGPLGKTPAMVISSTEAECVSPENNLHLDWAPVNLTLNNQNYTDEDIRFIYYNPPQIIDAFPLKGPVRGGTEVNIWGNKYEKNKNITCFFGNNTVIAKYVSKSHLICQAPLVMDPGVYKLIVKYENDRFQSDVMSFQYFDNPEILQPLQPSCGPTKGFTQILIRGKNFIEFGFGKAKCVFNSTYYTNATVTDPNTLYCDSPPLDTSSGDMWYNVSVSLDGDQVSNSTQNFTYYDDPIINKLSPWNGPLSGDTIIEIFGKGFNQTNICDLTVRFGQKTVYPSNIFYSNLTVNSSQAKVPGEVVVSVSGNNQQFINDRILHFRDVENTFQYYQPFIIEISDPQYLSNSGNSPLTLKGLKFDQFRYDNGSERNVTLQCRFLDNSNNIIGNSVINLKKISDFTQICVAPKTTYSGNATVQISSNNQQWQDIQESVIFYNGPKVTSINPTSGVTKNPKGLSLLIYGQNFQCPQKDCSNIKVRFTNAKGDYIYVDGNFTQAGAVQCQIPKYPAPETLNVDVSFNGKDFTNDGIQFGFQDPFILDIFPRLISTKGTTTLYFHGYGFVQLDDSSSLVEMKYNQGQLLCSGSPCTKVYSVQNENLAQVGTYPQSSMLKDSDNTNIAFDAFTVNMMNPDGDYSQNDIHLFYYQDPVLANLSSLFAYSNEEKPIIIQTDFSWENGNNYQFFKKYSNFTCKFTSTSYYSKTSVVTNAIFESSPVGQFIDQLPNQIRCTTPKWGVAETVNLQISVNGQDYFGQFQFSFVDQLQILRISPLSGPLGGSTQVKIYGQGFNASNPNTEIFIKFGTQQLQTVDKTAVFASYWSEDEYYNELQIPKNLLKSASENVQQLQDGYKMNTYVSASSPDISRNYEYDNPDVLGMGGPVYVQVGEKVSIVTIDHNVSSPTYNQSLVQYIETVYPQSSRQEFYFYRQPFVKKIQPSSGLTDGGTIIDITGGWFDEKPQYGVFSFCKVGNSVIRAKFIQTNRIQCISPSSQQIGMPLPIQVSLNGVDFTDSGFTFNYYQKPILLDIRPKSGSIEGGTEIWLKGEKFSNITNGLNTVKCRFTQIASSQHNSENADEKQNFDVDNAPVRYIPAYFIDKETMKCASPAGWAGGDTVKVDVTFNGVDYTDNSFDFNFYSIFGSFPKSGPADATNQFIQIRGIGFRTESLVLCSYNNTQVAPISVHYGLIKCPMVLDSWPADKYESIPFSILIDGSRYSFGNFRYFKQITIDSVTPLIGPQEGRGAIYFIGKDFRDDFENSKLGCRIGNTLGHAQLIDSETIRCTISNKLPLLDEGESLLCSVALNSYSWGQSDFSMKPYGINEIYPSSGPISQNTNILVVGKGFNNDLKEFARCKFGTDDNYIIVDAQVLDNEHLICKSPSEEITLPESADQQISLPFSVAFQEDLYYPFTEGPYKFRLYKHPVLTDIQPSSSQVGRLTEVYIIADEDNGFWQPTPSASGELNEQYGLKCKFGRFGTSQATYINKTTLLCLTPNIQEDPSSISTENVEVSVAMNGIDFNDDQTQLNFQFIGTGGSISTWVIIMGTIIFGLLIVSVLVFLGGLQEFMQAKAKENIPRHSYTVQDERGAPGLRVASRSSSSRLGMGQPRPRSFQNAGSRAGDNAARFGSRAGGLGASDLQ